MHGKLCSLFELMLVYHLYTQLIPKCISSFKFKIIERMVKLVSGCLVSFSIISFRCIVFQIQRFTLSECGICNI